MAGVLPAHQPAGEQGEACLHEEHQVPCEESPVEVDRNAVVPDRVGELDRERLFGCLGLVFVEFLFLFPIVRGFFVGRLSNDKSITGRIDSICLVPRGNSRGVGLGLRSSRRRGGPEPPHLPRQPAAGRKSINRMNANR